MPYVSEKRFCLFFLAQLMLSFISMRYNATIIKERRLFLCGLESNLFYRIRRKLELYILTELPCLLFSSYNY